MKEFWMLWAVGGETPKVQHPTYSDAEKEAFRLMTGPSSNRRPVQVYILKAVSVVEHGDPTNTVLTSD